MAYRGPDRRIHKVFVTKNTEYHTKSDVCVGVRDRETGTWHRRHQAVSKKLCGSIMFSNGGMRPNTGLPKAGESLFFHGSAVDVVTSTLETVERPLKKIVTAYPTLNVRQG